MNVYLYNTVTEKLINLGSKFDIRHETEEPFIFLTESVDQKPIPEEGFQVIESDPFIDLVNKLYVKKWATVEIPAIDPDSLVPNSLTPRQLRLALLSKGIMPNDISEMLVGNPAAFIEWEYSLEIKRDHPLVAQMAQALSLSDSDVKQIFIEYSNI